MAVSHDYVGRLYSRTLHIVGTLATGDDQASFILPVNSKVVFIDCVVQTAGTGTVSENIMVENLTDSENLLSAVMVPATAGTAVEGTLHGTAANLICEDGDSIGVNVDQIHGTTGAKELTVNIDLLAL